MPKFYVGPRLLQEIRTALGGPQFPASPQNTHVSGPQYMQSQELTKFFRLTSPLEPCKFAPGDEVILVSQADGDSLAFCEPSSPLKGQEIFDISGVVRTYNTVNESESKTASLPADTVVQATMAFSKTGRYTMGVFQNSFWMATAVVSCGLESTTFDGGCAQQARKR